MGTGDLLAMPYSQRRIIVVRDGATSDAAPRKPLMPAIRLMASVVPAAGMALLAVDLFNARREMRQGGETLLPVSSIEAAQLQFPVGHPRGKVAYIGHPIDPPVYIPVADFHRFLFEHKVAEALRLIRFLGAVTVEVVRVEGWDQSIGVELGVTLPDVSQVVQSRFHGERSSCRVCDVIVPAFWLQWVTSFRSPFVTWRLRRGGQSSGATGRGPGAACASGTSADGKRGARR